MDSQLRHSEQQCSDVRDELRNVLGHVQSREQRWMGSRSKHEHDVRSDASERQGASGASEHEWHLQRPHLVHAIGSVVAQIGGQPAVIDEQRSIISRAEGHIVDLNTRAGGELNAVASARIDVEKRVREARGNDKG